VYTQCPDCATVFRVTAEALRAAQGDVRCGVCSTSFNALENLSEQAFKSAPAPEDGSPDDSMTVEELPGNENIELSSPVELVVVPGPESAAPVAEAAQTEDDEERALEFHGNAADLDRLFVIETPEVVQFDPAAVAATLSVHESKNDLDSTDEHPILVLDEQDEPAEAIDEVEEVEGFEEIEEAGETIVLESEPPPPPPPSIRSESPTSTHTAPRILIPDAMRRRLAEEAAARAAAAQEFEPQESDGFLSQRWPWVAGVAVLAFLFAVQVVHSKRNELVKSPGIGPAIAGTYSFFGLTLLSPTDLSAYELRQWGAASDPSEANRLLLRASIVNHATYAQPFPLLRLVLQDRFGGTLGLRDIGPADYLPGGDARGLLQPGERADAVIRIVDPGTEAVGFELDICLPAQGGVRCANQIKTARQ
jgi:predicted Zn finger-like uncharacterized protein